jgi:hypothetical protein
VGSRNPSYPLLEIRFSKIDAQTRSCSNEQIEPLSTRPSCPTTTSFVRPNFNRSTTPSHNMYNLGTGCFENSTPTALSPANLKQGCSPVSKISHYHRLACLLDLSRTLASLSSPPSRSEQSVRYPQQHTREIWAYRDLALFGMLNKTIHRTGASWGIGEDASASRLFDYAMTWSVCTEDWVRMNDDGVEIVRSFVHEAP